MASPSAVRPAVPTLAFAAVLAASLPARAGKVEDVLKSFERNGQYVAPIATLYGSLANTGWYQGSAVGRGFGFYFGVPVGFTALSDDDRTYRATFVDDGCRLYHQDHPTGTECRDEVSYSAPTLFGRGRAPTLKRTQYNPNTRRIEGTMDAPVSDGEPEAAALNWLPFLAPQLGVGLFHTEAKLRYVGTPTLFGASFQLLGLGVQHDLRSVLPPLPVNLALAGNASWISAGYEPRGDIDGTLELDGLAWFAGLLVGYDLFGRMEVFLEAGWEGATLESGGVITLKDANGVPEETVRPGLTIEGRNGFRTALNVAVHFGWQGVAGQNFGANLGQHINLVGYRYK